jgi:hypothetical protein
MEKLQETTVCSWTVVKLEEDCLFSGPEEKGWVLGLRWGCGGDCFLVQKLRWLEDLVGQLLPPSGLPYCSLFTTGIVFLFQLFIS